MWLAWKHGRYLHFWIGEKEGDGLDGVWVCERCLHRGLRGMVMDKTVCVGVKCQHRGR